MAVAVASQDIVGFAAHAATLTLNVPTGTVDGDVLLGIVGLQRNETITATGWTTIAEISNTVGASQTIWVGSRIAPASPPSTYDITLGTGTSLIMYGAMLRVTGADTAALVNAVATIDDQLYGSSGVGNPVFPSVTTDIAGTLILRLSMFEDDCTGDTPADHTSIDNQNTTISYDMYTNSSYEEFTGSGAAGTAEVTNFTKVSQPGVLVTIAIAPAEESSSIIPQVAHHSNIILG